MGEVIKMFRTEPDDDGGGSFDVRTVLTDELESSVLDIQHRIEELWLAQSPEEFKEGIRQIKSEVKDWPDA